MNCFFKPDPAVSRYNDDCIFNLLLLEVIGKSFKLTMYVPADTERCVLFRDVEYVHGANIISNERN